MEARAVSIISSAQEQARDLREGAIELRVQADRLTRAPLVMLSAEDRSRGPEDTRFLDAVVRALDGAGPLAMRDIADHLAASPARVRAALNRLIEVGTVTKSGIKSGTRYTLADDTEEAPAGAEVHALKSYEAVVRDAAIQLDTFEFVDLQRALPDVSEPTLRRWVRALEERGIFASERVGPAKVYAYVREEGTSPARPRHATPEQEATRDAARSGSYASGTAIAGTGKGTRSGSSIVNELIREVRPYGITIEKTKHTVSFTRGGVVIATASSTPGASSLKQTRSELRKAGVPV
jgi:hypothetical protein